MENNHSTDVDSPPPPLFAHSVPPLCLGIGQPDCLPTVYQYVCH
jgi:hypothetical protein